MKKVIKASKLRELMKYYNDPDNYNSHPDDFSKVESILGKYGDEDDDPEILFYEASTEDKDKMLALVKPHLRLGERGYSAQLYRQALRGDIEGEEYCDGIADMIHALITEGLLDRNEFSAFEPEGEY